MMHQLHATPNMTWSDRFENMHLKIEDQQAMIHSTQKRLEELFALLQGQDHRILRLSSTEQTMAAKLDMALEKIDIIFRDGHRGASREHSTDGGGNSKPGGNDGHDGGLSMGGGGLAFSFAEKEAMKKTEEVVESLSRLMSDLDRDLKALKIQVNSMNSVLTVLQTEMSFKLDREIYEQGMDTKLDKDEFYSRMNEGGIGEDVVKKLELDIRKLGKKVDSADEDLAKKIRKLKKKLEELEGKTTLNDDRMKELMESYLKTKLSEKGDGADQRTNADFGSENGRNVREELDDFGRTINRLNAVIGRIRNDQLRALASCKNALCLSCGRGDVNFMPPMEFARGSNGQYYRAESQDPALFDHGMDVFTKQEICKEHTMHAHIPVDAVLSGDADILDRATPKPLPKTRVITRPQTAAVRIQSKVGKAMRQDSPGPKKMTVEINQLTVSGL